MTLNKKIIGLRLESVRLSRGGVTFEFAGMKNGEHYNYRLSTGFEICFDIADLFKRDIVDDESTIRLWACLEQDLEEIILSDDGRVCELQLGNEKSIFIWAEDPHDNLLIVKRYQSDEWFTIG